ncbi:multiple coagulation factor deficiency protein 2 homolog [Anneissia japonica]|uniref:multiple coagulation factor deficiency protein 2 homolog n=1 Tax=Anneissia japonica TaxID=1529436 RepID=UPI00142594C1|nr:multiple coagulation factor deficiency protein 2 homolog [Anneissia japonica]
MRHRRISHLGLIVTFLILIAGDYGRLTYAEDRSKFHDADIVRNQDHIKEHLQEEVDIDTEAEMTNEELEFHYFKLHDFDNNTKLDGLEILSAISHVVPFEPKSPETKTAQQIRDEKMDFFADIIEQVLKEDDYNNDGYLTYLEYVLSRRRTDRGA